MATACTDDPLVSMPASDGGSGSQTSFEPPSSTSETTAEPPITSTLPTTGSASTGELTATSGPDGSICGDGVVGEEEQCDLGEANANAGACTLECKLASCGDGLVQEGIEQCDFGLGNDDSYDGCLDCAFGPRCGDGLLQAEHEICDRGALNGTGVTDDELAPCSLVCGYFGRLLFITSQQYSGNLGGVSGADLKCQAAAAAAGLEHAHTYRAWLSDNFQAPETRFDQWELPGVPVILPGGVVVADDLADLVGNGPHTGIARTELGDSVFNRPVWTNTSAFGEIFSIDDHCENWLAADIMLVARRGFNALVLEQGVDWDLWRAERWWTSFETSQCKQLAHLYCIDDGFVLEQER
ncbi:hypothetical protein [Nannocystis bainbridge]|uniref:Myxococcus cysteine-rich repeat-containing protein n=1 Tax=Nannocystis bainbridge TaxID=2995303 RepID=A0ABT5DXI0_9BACT|nr:hypothetical protein [Nannocystis bainbridge]MDC0718334.1 hypothetical protein [Nannocystis bainbridge]